MKESKEQQELFTIETRKFFEEFEKVQGKIYEALKDSGVNNDIKEKCRKVIEDLSRGEVKKELDKSLVEANPYVLTKDAIINLLNILGKKDEEKRDLFETLRKIICEARDSVIDKVE